VDLRLSRAFRHEHGRFGPGDFDEADDSVEHHPTVEAGVSASASSRSTGASPSGWIGRLLQPFVWI
jgi:putative transcriptional regulator